MKQIITSAIFLVIGIFVGKYTFSENPLKNYEEITNDKKIGHCNCQDELKKAQLLYGKVFTTFLASIGLRLDDQKQDRLSQILKNPNNYLKDNEIKSSKPRQNSQKDSLVKKNSKPAISKSKREIPPPYEYEQLSIQGKNFILKKPSLYYIESKYIENFNESLSKLNGSYTGKLYKTKKDEYNNTADDILLEINFTEAKDNKIDGSFYLQLSSNGNPYSTSNGSGGNRNLRVNPKNPNIILMKSGRDAFFQFNIRKPTVLNYYKDGKHAGYAKIIKN